jgi:hypothetical protein
MAHLYRDREMRPILKVELKKALSMRETIKRAGWWN